jgi:hypothetical protein
LIFRTSFKQIPRELIEAATPGRRRTRAAFHLQPGAAPFGPGGFGLGRADLCLFSGQLRHTRLMLGIPKSYYVLPTLIYRRLASFGPSIIAEIPRYLAMLTALIGIMRGFDHLQLPDPQYLGQLRGQSPAPRLSFKLGALAPAAGDHPCGALIFHGAGAALHRPGGRGPGAGLWRGP